MLLNTTEETGNTSWENPPLKIIRNQEIQVKNLQNILLQFATLMEYYGSSVQQHHKYVHVKF